MFSLENTFLTLDEYQDKANKTFLEKEIAEAMNYHPMAGLIYLSLKLTGEAGEVAEKVGKLIRDKGGKINGTDREAILKELGDVLWYIAEIAEWLDASLSHVANVNIAKLARRKEQGLLQGNGDDREVK